MSAPYSSPYSRFACGLALFALLAPLGCGGSSTPIGRVVSASQATVDLLKSVTDPASATAATPKLKPTFTELGEANVALANIVTDPGKALALMSEARKAMSEMQRLQTALQAEADRLDKLKGLPVEFWNVLRVESYKFANAAVSAVPGAEGMAGPVGQVVALYEQYGPQRIVEVKLTGVSMGDKDAAITRLTELAGEGAQVVPVEDPTDYDKVLVTVAPVEDYDKFVASIDFGNVTDQEAAKGEATVELPEADLGESASASGSDDAPIDESTPVDEYGQPLATGGRGDYLGEQPAPGPAESVVGGFLGALSAAAEAQRVAAEAKAAAGPQRGDRDYHAQMAELLYDAQSPHHERAVTELLEVKPTAVADKKVRARIANGYRQLAFESGTHAAKAVDGLAHWGGKFSAPLLIELLEKQTSGGGDEAIYNGLGKVATVEAADAVVKRLESSSGGGDGDAAFACLRTMGPVAEASLIRALPLESPDSNRAAIEVLGEIGTRKSLSLLRRATKSESQEVKEAALAALRSIQERLRKEKAAAEPSGPKKPAAASSTT